VKNLLVFILPLMAIACARSQIGAVRSDRIEPHRPPDVLFIVADDLNPDLNCYGNAQIHSPNIDRLAAKGMRFDHAYCQYPLCNPSRISFLSGLRPETTKIFDNDTQPRKYVGNVTLFPEYFHNNGYFTARVGKIAHSKYEDSISWDLVLKGALASPTGEEETPYSGPSDTYVNDQGKAIRPPFWKMHVTDAGDEQTLDGQTARLAAEVLAKSHDKPLFLAVGFHRPHLPLEAPRKYFQMYDPAKIQLPPEPENDRDDIPFMAISTTSGPQIPLSPTERRNFRRAYYACISFVDAQVGVIMDALERSGRLDNTIVVLCGDHGFHMGEHGGMRNKETLYDQADQIPLIVVAPAMNAGASGRMVEFIDVYPSLVELAGLPAAAGLEGKSFAPLMREPNRAWKKGAYTIVGREGNKKFGRSVRTERYRYTEWDEGRGGIELYDYENDPNEYTNRAKDPGYATVAKELKDLLHRGEPGT
jgi:iduronate 2-sulfatase